MNIAVRGKPIHHNCHISDVTKGILNVLLSLDKILTETPPIVQPQRFGNKAFKIWYDQVKQVNISIN